MTAKRDDDWRNLEYTKKKCPVAFGETISMIKAKEAVDELNNKEGSVRFEKRGCQRVVCASPTAAIDVCREPTESVPEVYEKPYSYIADYVTGIMQEWCPKMKAHSMIPIQMDWVGGEVSDPAGLAIRLHRDNCK